jgi:hypothetical protein
MTIEWDECAIECDLRAAGKGLPPAHFFHSAVDGPTLPCE